MTDQATHPAPFSEAISNVLREIIKDWPGPILDPYAGIGGVHDLGRDDTYGVEIEKEWADQSEHTAWGDSRTLRPTGDEMTVESPLSDWTSRRIYMPQPLAIVTSPDYGNRMADKYLGSPAERAEREATGKLPRRRGYAISLNRPVTEGSGAGWYFRTDEYRQIHTEVMRAVTNVMRRPGKMALNVSDFIADGQVQPVMAWWMSMVTELGWRFVDASTVRTPRYRDGENSELRVPFEWIVLFDLPVATWAPPPPPVGQP